MDVEPTLEEIIANVLHEHGDLPGGPPPLEASECPRADAHFGSAERIAAALEDFGFRVFRPDDCSMMRWCEEHMSTLPRLDIDGLCYVAASLRGMDRSCRIGDVALVPVKEDV